jgi:hypothetical protein
MVSFPFIERADKKGYWINELESLGISPKQFERDYEIESDCIKELDTARSRGRKRYSCLAENKCQ